jgi:hypothetical protein
MHEKEKQRQQRIREKQKEMEEAKRRSAPPARRIHSKNFVPKHAALSDSAARDAGSRLHMSALEARKKVELARIAKEEKELAVAKAAVPKTNASAGAGARAKHDRADIWSELSRRRRKGGGEEIDDAASGSDRMERKALSSSQLEAFVVRQQQDVSNREDSSRRGRDRSFGKDSSYHGDVAQLN